MTEHEEILLDANTITLEKVDLYLRQRIERAEKNEKTYQDFLFEMIAELILSQDDDAPTVSQTNDFQNEQSADVWQALRLITSRLEQIDKKMPQTKEKAPRTEQLAKERCKAVARYLWKLNPDMTIIDVAAHEAVYNLGITDGQHYLPETVRKWVAEVDPRKPENKVGRPRKQK